MRKSRHLQAIDNYKERLFNRIALVNSDLATELRAMQLGWYRISNNATVEDTTEVYIYDEIGGSFGVSADDFVKDLNEITTPKINVRINSPGGSLFDSIAIHNALAQHPAKVRTTVDALAASGASIIAMAANRYNEANDTGGVVMMPGSQMMIHDALGVEMGNAADMRAMANFLDRQSDNIAVTYKNRAGGTAEEWRSRMLAETWMFAEEAVSLKLADKVFTQDEEDDAPSTEDELIPAAVEPENSIRLEVVPELVDLMKRDFSFNTFKYKSREEAPAPRNTAEMMNILRNTLTRKA